MTPTRLAPVTLERGAVRLEPLAAEHVEGIAAAAADGELWRLWFTGVPRPEEVPAWFEDAMAQQEAGRQLAWAVRDLDSGAVVGSTRYHDVVAAIGRVEIGYTWYASSVQRTHVNSTCKLLLLEHAFDSLGCAVVGLRTDNFNHASQRAIAALGAHRDGVLRHHSARRDGSVRDTVMFSILAAEWPDVRRHLEHRLARHGTPKDQARETPGPLG
ncbi:MAG: GNAT family N-acetyltransferase [Actinomycetota bacterium]|nr:GNAT family N-acetyltransferase [Actinomycetota bacterium]